MLVGDGWAFVHIPKCGGSTVRAILKGWECVEVLPMFPRNTVDHGFHWVGQNVHPGSFTFVRHPVIWLCSYWSERAKESRKSKNIHMRIQLLDRLWTPDPSLFLTRVAINAPGYVGELFDAYTAYAVNVHRLEDGIDHVLSDILGKPVSAPIKNTGWAPKVTERARRLVISSERAALEKYGYTKC